MVAGIEILFFRPDDEVRKLAELALELDLADADQRETRSLARAGRISYSACRARAGLRRSRRPKEPMVLVLDRAGLLTRAPGLDGRPPTALQRDARLHREAGDRRGDRADRSRRSGPRASACLASTATCSRATMLRPSPRCASSRRWFTRLSRTTTSTSSTGITRFSGIASVRSGTSSRPTTSWPSRGCLLPAPLRDPPRALRPLDRLGDRDSCPRTDLLAARGGD